MSIIGSLHHNAVYKRRIVALAHAVAGLLAPGPVLDVGCGNGMLGQLIMSLRDDIRVFGLDEHMRSVQAIPIVHSDGHTLPFKDGTFSSVMIIDTLHHADDQAPLLAECLRVARDGVVVKDHFFENQGEHLVLRALDWVGNASHGVRLNYNYFSRGSWADYLGKIGAAEVYRREQVDAMYPQPLQALIGRRIQFVAKLVPTTLN